MQNRDKAKKVHETEWIVDAPYDLVKSLAREFQSGPIINDAGQHHLTEQQIGSLNGLKMEIFSREHPPPHFRVIYAGETANFTIKDCTKLNGGLNAWERTIRKWHIEHKQDLIETWDRTRPSNCPVGKYVE
jgi:Domain of unknown function (DUF4160)